MEGRRYNVKVQDFDELDRLYKFMNNDFSGFSEEIRYYCGTMMDVGETEEQLAPYNPIPSMFNILEGRLLAQPVAHSRSTLQTQKAMQQKTDEFIQEIRASVEEQLALIKMELQFEQQGFKPDEIAKKMEAERSRRLPQHIDKKNYQAQGEITFAKLLQSETIRQDVKTKKLDTLKDLMIGARLCTYAGWRYGKPYLDTCNPLYLEFERLKNKVAIEKSSWVLYHDKLAVTQAIQEYGEILDKKEFESLIESSPFSHGIRNAMIKPLRNDAGAAMLKEYTGGDSYTNEWGLDETRLGEEIHRVHCEFKAFEQVIFLSYKDKYGVKVTEKLPSDADVIPENASGVKFTNRFLQIATKWVWVDEITQIEYEAEVLYIPRRYEWTLLNHEILVNYRKVPFQPDYHEDPFGDFELSYKGGLLYSRNATWISPLMRALPYAFQKMSVKRLMDKELAKFEGKVSIVDLDQIPTNLGEEHSQGGNNIQDAVLKAKVIARKTSTYYYSGSNLTRTGTIAPNTRSVGIQHQVVDTSSAILQLQQIGNLIDVEAGMVLGIPPQSQAIVIPGTNASDNRQALIQHTLATQIIFYYLEAVWNRALDEHMANMITWIEMNMDEFGLSFESMLPDGSPEFFKVMDKDVEFMRDLGLTLHSNGREQVYFDLMTQQVFNIGQNGGEGAEQISAMIKALTTSASPSEVHDMITKASAEQQKRLAERQQQESEMQKQLAEKTMELEQFRSEMKLEADTRKISAQGDENARTAAIQADALRLQSDVDKNEVNDQLQRDREQRDFDQVENAKDRELDLKLARLKSKPTA